MNKTEVDQMDRIESKWTEQDRIRLNWTKEDRIRPKWIEQDQIRAKWTGLAEQNRMDRITINLFM